jgi:hypothetical protein
MAPSPPSGRPRRTVRSPGDLAEIAALTLALSAAGAAAAPGAAADSGSVTASSGQAPPAASGDGGHHDQGSEGGGGHAGQAPSQESQSQPQSQAPASAPAQPPPPPPQAPAQSTPPAQAAPPAQRNAPAHRDAPAAQNAPAPQSAPPAHPHAPAPQSAPPAHPHAPAPQSAPPAHPHAPAQPSPPAPAHPSAPAQQSAPAAHPSARPHSHAETPASPNAGPHPAAQTPDHPNAPARPNAAARPNAQARPNGSGQGNAPAHDYGRPHPDAPGRTYRHGHTGSETSPYPSRPAQAKPSRPTSHHGMDRPAPQPPATDSGNSSHGPNHTTAPVPAESYPGRGTREHKRGGDHGNGNRHSHRTPAPAKPPAGAPKEPRRTDDRPAPPIAPSHPPVLQNRPTPAAPIVVSQAQLSRLTRPAPAPRATDPAPIAVTATPQQTGPGAVLHRAAADLLAVAHAARSGGYAWGHRAATHLADAGRAAADVNRLSGVGSPIRTAPLLVAVPEKTLGSETHRRATPDEQGSPATLGGGRRARVAELATSAAKSVAEVLAYGVLVGVVFFLAAYGLALARVRLLAERDAGRRFGSRASFSTMLASMPELARFMRGVSVPDTLPAPEPESANGTAPPATTRFAAVAPAEAPAPTARADAGPSPRRRHAPWQPDEIVAGLLIGCRTADERNAVLSQRVLRALAQEDARIPSWAVVDRAARRGGQTGGAWLREARRRYADGRIRHAVAAPDSAEGHLQVLPA